MPRKPAAPGPPGHWPFQPGGTTTSTGPLRFSSSSFEQGKCWCWRQQQRAGVACASWPAGSTRGRGEASSTASLLVVRVFCAAAAACL
eukprot:365366-Chlamydomonas_euryale.AAC.21